jgi:MinD superfamily P-loop ATPase
VQLLDCDVEEPNAHILLKPTFSHKQVVTILVPVINEEKCTYCGRCAEVCVYNALAVIGEQVLVFPELCHGCGACSYLCPEAAITEHGKEIGVVECGRVGDIDFVHGRLNIGEVAAPRLIGEVKGHISPDSLTLIDAPPGASCPVVTAVAESDFCLLVTEPTSFGLNDLTLAVDMLRKLGIPSGVVINRDGIGDRGVEDYCREEGIPVLLRIPLDIEIARLYSKGITLVAGMPEWKEAFVELSGKIKRMAGRERGGLR